MTKTAETHDFGAQVKELLDLVIHSLYTHPEIFLRELVSNSSDALDKLRFLALKEPALVEGDEQLGIELEVDREARTLTVADNGVGMDHDDLIANLGTIASSGTRRFLDELRKADARSMPELIGQFGVGFYASFMVADEVVVETRKAGDDQGWRWRSKADGRYEIEPAPDAARGTRITLHMKEKGDDDPDFLNDYALRQLVRRYSDFVEYPIRLGEETINTQKPLWARPKAEIERKEYDQLYRHLTHDWNDPLEVVHFKAEGATEYTALLFIPAKRPAELFDPGQARVKLSLYVRRVFITAECEDLLPGWLRFVRGVVEASDLPLNVSREVLQHNPHVRAIKKRLTKKVLDALAELLERDREAYRGFFREFGPMLKEGVCVREDEDERIAKLLLFESSAGEEPTTLAEYVARMKDDQQAIWYATGRDRATLEASPHLELFRARGQEVLYFLDPVDEWMIDGLTEFGGKPLRAAQAADVDLATDEERERARKAQEEAAKFLRALADHYGEGVQEVRFTARLVDSPGVLVSEGGALRPHMQRFLAETRGAESGPPARILELNPDHPLVERLRAMHAADPDGERVWSYADLLYGQALLAEGSALPDPSRFARLVAELMVEGGD